MCIVSRLGFVLECCGVDGDSSGLFLGGFIDFGVFDVFGSLLGSEIFGYG